jgi:hypothetical protein
MLQVDVELAPWERRLLFGPNPFEPAILPFDRRLPVPDVMSIHARATARLISTVDAVRFEGAGRTALVRGESGTGKTHLLHRVARMLDGRAWFATVDPIGSAPRLLGHTLRRIVTDLAKTGSPFFGTALRELAASLLTAGLNAVPAGPAKEELIERMVGADAGFMQTDSALRERCIDACARALSRANDSVDEDVVRVLLRLWLRDRAPIALDWLRGIELDDEELRMLGVAQPLSDPALAAGALRTLGVLAQGCRRPIVVCFDQTETLESIGGQGAVAALFSATRTLASLEGFAVVVTCLEDLWARRFARIAEEHGAPGLEDGAVSLERLGPEDALRIVEARIGAALGDIQPPYPSFPVPPRTVIAMRDLSAREVLSWCSARLEEMRREGELREIEPPVAAVRAVERVQAAALDEAWRGARERVISRAPDKDAFVDGLIWLLRAARDGEPGERWPAVSAFHREPDDAAVVVELDGEREIRILVSDTQNAAACARLLKHAVQDAPNGTTSVLVRLLPLPSTWKLARKRVDALRDGGGRFFEAEVEHVAAVAAVRHLAGKVAAGEVVADGRAVSIDEAERFFLAQDHLGALLERIVEG